MDPAISVICASFNKDEHLINQILSLANQTFPHDQFEYLLADDGSNDRTFAVVQEAKRTFDFPIRAFHFNRPPDSVCTLPYNFLIKQAKAPIILHTQADIMFARDAIEWHLKYQEQSENIFVFGRCYQIHSEVVQALLNTVPWRENFQSLEELFITEYHHSQYWNVPYNASIQKKWLEQIRGYDESYNARWAADSDLVIRLEHIGVQMVNAPEIFSAHQYHIHYDHVCESTCKCPLRIIDMTEVGQEMKYNGYEENIVRNKDCWGEFPNILEI